MDDPLHEFQNIINKSIDIENSSISNFSSYNVTQEPWKDSVKPIVDYLLLVILIVVMLAMGCEVTWAHIWVHVRRPVGLVIGLISQFCFKPLCSYAILLSSGITGLHATGVLIIACCPGGVLSNTFTYFCDGDLGLSIAMTSASTLMAMGFMPGNLWLYGRSFESEELTIPYKEMAMSLISVTSPVVVGMILHWKMPKVAKIVAKIGSYCGLLIMFICIAIELVVFPNMFDNVPLELYFLVVALPFLGLGMGYLFSFLVRQNVCVCKTVAIECGVQNVPVALTIIAMSFPVEQQGDIVLLPWLYGFFMITGCSILTLVYYWYKKRSEKLPRKEITLNHLKENGNAEEAKDLMESNSIKIVPKSTNPVSFNGEC